MDTAREVTVGLPWGVRPLEHLRVEDAAHLGDEAADLAALQTSGVCLAPAWVVALAGEDAVSRLVHALELASRASPAGRAQVRPLYPTRALAARFERRADLGRELHDPTRSRAVAEEFLAAVGTPEVTASLGGSRARLHALVVALGEGARGRAASADPIDGDPDRIRVWEAAVTPWLVDRRTARVVARGEGYLEAQGASQVADLVDRAQLEIGRPVEIAWTVSWGKPSIIAVRSLSLAPRFTTVSHRIVALIRNDEGVVAPLAIDALDKALRQVSVSPEEPKVRRIYARPYRRMEERPMLRRATDPASLLRASARAAQVAADVAAPLSAVRHFQSGLDAQLAALDAVDLSALDDRELGAAVRDRQRLVVEALVLLDRGRRASIAVLGALEATVGALPRDCLGALTRPRIARSRRRLYDRMQRLARRIEQEHGELVGRAVLGQQTRRRWDELREDLVQVRPVGIDVRPEPFGADDRALMEALASAPWDEDDSRERARRDALRRILATARQKPLGRSRGAIAASLGLLVRQLARSKGNAAEGLSVAMLRLREGALEAGRRLSEVGLVDDPHDVLYLCLEELEQGLAGEPGAYAARVRLRREDDLRWGCYSAPRRIGARHPDQLGA